MAQMYFPPEDPRRVSPSTVAYSLVAGFAIGGPLFALMGVALLGSIGILIVASPLLVIFAPFILLAGFVLSAAVAGFSAGISMAAAGVWALAKVYGHVRRRRTDPMLGPSTSLPLGEEIVTQGGHRVKRWIGDENEGGAPEPRRIHVCSFFRGIESLWFWCGGAAIFIRSLTVAVPIGFTAVCSSLTSTLSKSEFDYPFFSSDRKFGSRIFARVDFISNGHRVEFFMQLTAGSFVLPLRVSRNYISCNCSPSSLNAHKKTRILANFLCLLCVQNFFFMERESKKRSRPEDVKKEFRDTGKRQEIIGFDDGDAFKICEPFRPLGVFEFPWQKENLVPEFDEWEPHDIFHCTLVEGLSSAFEHPGDTLFQSPLPIILPEEKLEDESSPSEEEVDGVDCIWSSVLRQPLSIGSKGSHNI
ncbi:hypothetical protein H6P81_008762 [Aristolochia fimbriata]|uniref:Oleosin n=1 Tax=Aristolochia fimbriata TaxID=158543 RepID=A0AAV7EMH4_ARIFI|nr:hypothetical protein H6P81_008762 [Aristolochia fimbriata]